MTSSNILRLRLGPVRLYLIKGGQQVQAMFGKSTVMSPDKFIVMVLRDLQGASEEDVARFVDDKSGRHKVPPSGYEDVPSEQRYWHTLHHFSSTGLAVVENTAQLAGKYTTFLGEVLEQQPLGEWSTVRLFEYLRRDMGESAIKSLCGTRFLEVNPDFIEQFWRFDSVSYQVMNGLPQWMDPKPALERDKMVAMSEKFLAEVYDQFGWDGLDPETYWEPTFGCSYVRGVQKWARDTGMTMRTRASFFVLSIFGLNANTVPVTTWCMMELLKDRSLFEAVRAEALQALIIDPKTGKKDFDARKLVSMPLMQSIYVEVMRLHVSIGITREVMEDTMLDGYRLRKGALIQAPTNLLHQDDEIWERDGHKASEFWAERHVRYAAKVDETTGQTTTERVFVMAGKPSEFFPYGGGVSMCPGRHFAKQEILLTLATLVARFDMELVEWTHMDGTKSDRAAKDNEKYFLNAAVPPDRDVKIRWKRLW
ncbi:25-hydroxycholesterol 7-alpha-hydroxylase [Colletotrichum orbiculare MAFF 240422]|uniref:25-hydroxycholesterol 7-alpha-hydroxylase n=1 Tax=Colletotrichum orbiculare (strain 104-T / ATCC 96160 / CBS 514.97 / LARS 414 / MAFF 240422) TaxID=1213857 RepID=N4VJ44_COLOR|nr:25-hydroxycholesterol 7-alpha-hydroxylase [Colletotrichum orbiculare MAFF 240422]